MPRANPGSGAAPASGDGKDTGTSSQAAVAPTANVAPAPAQPASVTTPAGITVTTVRDTSVQQSGVISVAVPRELSSSGFSFPLPQQVLETADAAKTPIVATTLTGSPLPSWVTYDAESKTFVATTVPEGGLPISVLVTVGDQRATVVISEKSE